MQTQPSLDEAADRLEHNATFVGILPALVIGALLVLVQPVVGVLVGLALAVGWVLAVRARIAARSAKHPSARSWQVMLPSAEASIGPVCTGNWQKSAHSWLRNAFWQPPPTIWMRR